MTAVGGFAVCLQLADRSQGAVVSAGAFHPAVRLSLTRLDLKQRHFFAHTANVKAAICD
jgi:hypothetical protein